MDSMDFTVRLSLIVTYGIALVLGSLGIFCLYWSCMGAPLAADAMICLGSATALVLSCERADLR